MRPSVAGKFFVSREKKWWAKGVTYGTFRPSHGDECYPLPTTVASDFALMAANGVNSIRTYTVPPRWLLDLAYEYRLQVLIGLPWEQHVAFLDSSESARQILARVLAGVRSCVRHPAVLAYAVGNEIPASIVRWHGPRAIERFLQRLYLGAKDYDPDAAITYVNFPTTEYLELPFLDLVCFNVYLESPDRLRAYFARLQNLAGDRPLLLTEVGLDSRRHGESGQAVSLDWQLRSAFAAGCAGAFVFSWTDEWYRGGYDIDDWDFGLTRRDRTPKPALLAVRRVFEEGPSFRPPYLPKISVIVCSYNGAGTIRECLDGLTKLKYPNYEVIVVDDGSTDETAQIAAAYPFQLIRTENRGLSSARNLGMKEATGEIVAYIDDDAWPDPDWLAYLVDTFRTTDHVGVGGPNVPPTDSGIAECVANAPGGPVHVLLSDELAEHIPGCNMAFRKDRLEAIGGFDSQFRTAGDDVDLCWRLQERGWTLGFNPAAMVWHRRRRTVRGYWRQQRGYGRAEALLEAKWPEKYGPSGCATWKGRIYGNGLLPSLLCRSRVYHGVWGCALFQSLYQPAPNVMQSISLMPDWYLIIFGVACLALLGVVWPPLTLAAAVSAAMLAVSVGQAVAGVRRARFTSAFHTAERSEADTAGARMAIRLRWALWKLRSLTTLLCLIQPLARLSGRLSSGLTPWRCRVRLPPSLPCRHTTAFWNQHWKDPHKVLSSLGRVAQAYRAVVIHGGDYDRWDIEVRAGLFGAVRVLLGVEEHGADRQLMRFRLRPRCGPLALPVSFIGVLIGSAAAADGSILVGGLLLTIALWPLARGAWESSLAMTVVLSSLQQLWPEGALSRERDRRTNGNAVANNYP